jgi:hypothetical protein
VKPDIRIDVFKAAYYDQKDTLEPEKDTMRYDFTNKFWNGLKDKLDHNELINIQIRGEVATSKSTAAMKIMETINKYLKATGKQPKTTSNYDCICGDQIEFNRFINKGLTHTATVIDEYSEVAKTGLNATVEQAIFKHYSDIFAQKYLHRIACSPTTILDENAIIILEIIGKDTKQKITRAKLQYRHLTENNMITIGKIDINVNTTLKADYYRRYRKKKFARMTLLEKHGIRDIRELEIAELVLDSYTTLAQMTKFKKPTGPTILATIEAVKRKHKRIYSLLMTQEIASRTAALLTFLSELYTIQRKQPKTPTERNYQKQAIKELTTALNTMLKEEQKLTRIYSEYRNIK